jgi:hypothetical protein
MDAGGLPVTAAARGATLAPQPRSDLAEARTHRREALILNWRNDRADQRCDAPRSQAALRERLKRLSNDPCWRSSAGQQS